MSEIIDALNQLEREKSVSKELVMEAIEKSLVAACEKDYGKNVLVEAHMDRETGAITVVRKKEVVEEVENDENQISLTEAKAMDDKYEIGDFVEYPLESMDFGRMAAQKARSIIIQNIKEGERDAIYERFACKEHDIVNGVVQRFVDNTIYISLDEKTETRLKENEQVKSEHYKVGDHIKLYVVEVKKPEKKENKRKDGKDKKNNTGINIHVYLTHPELVKRLFEQEVPEIYDGVVEIKSISREAGSRTKMAVYSSNPDVDAIGSCIGNKGARVNKIVEELGGEKIDIVLYSDDPEKYISAALSPASVCKVEITDEETKSCRATVPDGQLSLAIGNKGQNARLAARLTGWRIDIRPESGFYGEDEDDEPKTEEKSEDVLDLDESTEGETVVSDETEE